MYGMKHDKKDEGGKGMKGEVKAKHKSHEMGGVDKRHTGHMEHKEHHPGVGDVYAFHKYDGKSAGSLRHYSTGEDKGQSGY